VILEPRAPSHIGAPDSPRSMEPPHSDLYKEAKAHQHAFMLWASQWDKFPVSIALNWDDFGLAGTEAHRIPEQRGVYAFLVQPALANGLNVSYLMYIGRTENLKRRFREYVRMGPYDRHPKLAIHLNTYRYYTRFCCATVPDGHNLPELEDALLEAFIPPLNTQFPSKISGIMRAFT